MATIDTDIFFLPGTGFHVRDEWRRSARPLYRRARVHAPGRLHFNVFDFTRMRREVPGAGGLGISTATARHEVVVEVGGAGPVSPLPTGTHLVRLFAELVGHDADDLRVRLPERITSVHSGFGSNVTFNTAVLAGLNALFGSPFSLPEVWEILVRNFVEVGDEARVYRGFDTGVGEACLLYGGLVWVDADARWVGSASADGLWVVTAEGDGQKLASDYLRGVGQAAERGIGHEEEDVTVATICADYQRELGEAHLRFLDERLKPMLLRDDARGLLSLGWEMNETGTYVLMTRLFRAEVLDAVQAAAREAGGLYFNMSSAGPSIFVMAGSEDDARRVAGALEERFGEWFANFRVGRAGEKLRIEVE
jgi:hypothetical protein